METYSTNSHNNFSVLIVDDSDEDRFTVRRLLQRSRGERVFDIREANTGARGLAACRESLPDCLLLDHNLGDTDGIALLGELNADRDPDDPLCPAVMLTSAGTEAQVAARALKGGAQDYLVKETLTSEGISLAIENAVEKVRLRRRAKQAELQFRSSLDNMPDCFGIYVAVRDPENGRILDFRCEYVNDAACRNNRMRAEEQVGQLLCDLLPAHRVNGLFEEYIRVVETGQPVEKISFLFGDTSFGGKSEYRERAFDIRAWKMGDGFAAVWRDVTDRERAEEWRRTAEDAEQQLAAAAQTLAYHVENTPLANVEWDGEFRVKSWSKQAEAVFGWTASEVLGKRPDAFPFVFPEDAGLMAGVIQNLLVGQEDRNVSLTRNLRRDGRMIWCEWYNSAERDTDGYVASILSLVLDVTEREEARARLHADLEREHDIADALQRSLLTRSPGNAFPGLVFETVYRPAGHQAEVGGDFYDVFDLKDGRVALVVGDISGKGMGAARHMAEVKFSLRAYLRSTGSATDALEYLNTDLCRLFGESADDSGAIPGFVCLSLALLDVSSGTVEMATAGAEPPLLMRSESGDAQELIGLPAPPLGAYEDAAFVTTFYDLKPGDLLLQITDGITEVRRQNGRPNEFLDYDGLIRLVRAALPMNDLGKIGQYVVREAEAFGGGALRDDACLLLARWEGPRP